MAKVEKESFSGINLINIADIRLDESFVKSPPSDKKIEKQIKKYKEIGEISKPIYVLARNGKYLLTDGYSRYCAAVKMGLSMIPARYGDKNRGKKESPLFTKGTVVEHTRWGKGIIVAADIHRIEVRFESGKTVLFKTAVALDWNHLLVLECKQDQVLALKEQLKDKEEYCPSKQINVSDVPSDKYCGKNTSTCNVLTVLRDVPERRIFFGMAQSDGARYYQLGANDRLSKVNTTFDLSATATNKLYLILKEHFEGKIRLNEDKDKAVNKTVSGDFYEWNEKEIDFVPAKEGKPSLHKDVKRVASGSKNRLNEIKARIKNKNQFNDYRGVSTRLMPHQKAACEIANDFDRFAFFYDTGTGKTVLSLEIMANKYQKERAKFLVICPKPIIKAAWMMDQQEFYPNMKLMPLSKNVDLVEYKKLNNRWNRIDAETVFHDKAYYTDWEFDKNKAEQFKYIRSVLLGKAEHYIVNGESFIRDFDSYMQMDITGLIVDESAVLKNFDSQLSQHVREFTKKCKYVYLLSGKPAPNNSSEYFSQMKIVDPETFYMSLKAFRARYYQNIDGRLQLLSFRKNELFEMIAKKSIIVSKTDCIDLPDTTRVIRKFDLPKSIMDHYNEMCYNLIATFKEMDKENESKPGVNKLFVANNKLSSMMKLREITSGFIKNAAGISTKIDDSKQRELFDLIDEIGDNQVIIWCQFKYEIENLSKALIKSGKRVVTAFSGTKNIDQSIEIFKSGRADILIAHPKTLQFGVTLVNCCFAIYYSMSYSFEQYEQSFARIYRKGQKNFCSYYFLQAENTIDEEIFTCVMDKKQDVETCEHILKSISEHASKYKGVR